LPGNKHQRKSELCVTENLFIHLSFTPKGMLHVKTTFTFTITFAFTRPMWVKRKSTGNWKFWWRKWTWLEVSKFLQNGEVQIQFLTYEVKLLVTCSEQYLSTGKYRKLQKHVDSIARMHIRWHYIFLHDFLKKLIGHHLKTS